VRPCAAARAGLEPVDRDTRRGGRRASGQGRSLLQQWKSRPHRYRGARGAECDARSALTTGAVGHCRATDDPPQATCPWRRRLNGPLSRHRYDLDDLQPVTNCYPGHDNLRMPSAQTINAITHSHSEPLWTVVCVKVQPTLPSGSNGRNDADQVLISSIRVAAAGGLCPYGQCGFPFRRLPMRPYATLTAAVAGSALSGPAQPHRTDLLAGNGAQIRSTGWGRHTRPSPAAICHQIGDTARRP
jgi:hypothetical protein